MLVNGLRDRTRVQPILGYNYGARNYDRVKQTLKLSVMGATGVMSLGFQMKLGHSQGKV
jgi:Na+-driven multidrug efflux pump